jgi:hypothetical protein
MKLLSAVKNPTDRDEQLAATARAHGCTPKWYDGMFGWRYHCGCKDHLHCSDQQCYVISAESAERSREP